MSQALADLGGRSYVAAARAALDGFDVPARLLHVRDFVWRGGRIKLEMAPARHAEGLPNVWYELAATWPAPILTELPTASTMPGLVPARTPVVDGQWTRGTAGYSLRLGIDPAVPGAFYLRADRTLSVVPFVHRPRLQVEQALASDLAAYVESFRAALAPVPQATAEAHARLQSLGL